MYNDYSKSKIKKSCPSIILFINDKVGNLCANWLFENYPDDIAALFFLEKTYTIDKIMSSGIKTFKYKSDNTVLQDLKSNNLKPDLGLLLWWPKLIGKKLISSCDNGFINTHPSFLPFNRGKHFNFWALVEKNPFGVSLHLVDEGIDSGNLIAQSIINYDWEDTGETLYRRAQMEMIDLFKTTYPKIRKLDFESYPQEIEKGSFHNSSEIDKISLIELDQSMTVRETLDLLRARTFEGKPACRFIEDGKVYEVRINIKRI